MIKFTIILPVYNSSTTINNTINSILNQTYVNFELLIIDDGSTDNSVDLILKYNDDRIKIFSQLNSGGPASPRNIGLINAKGDWIAFIDSDDIWHINKLLEISMINDISQYHLISHGTIMNDTINHNSFIYYPKVKLLKKYELLRYGNPFVLSSLIVSKDFQKKNNIFFNESYNFKSVEDFQFIIELCNAGINEYFLIKKELTTYLIHEQGISKSINTHMNNLTYLYNFNIEKNSALKYLYLKSVYYSTINLIWFNISKNILKQTKYKYLLKSFIFNPILFLKKLFKKI